MNELDKEIIAAMRLDWEQVYTQHREAERMVQSMFKVCISVISFPVLAAAVLATNKAFDISNGLSFLNLPDILAIICILTAIFLMLPLLSLIEHQATETYCKNAVNDIRKLFYDLKGNCENKILTNWKSMLPLDNTHPKKFRVFSSPHLSVVIFGFLSSLYMAAGIVSYVDSGIAQFIFIGFIWFFIQYLAYRVFVRIFK
ncbi:MAG: hypothetical protein ACH255_00960 [Candidatus Thiodiazotropha sp.]